MGSPASVIVTYQRGGGIRPPQDNEYCYVEEDGAFVLWRSIAWATYPPTPVGRFAGKLTADDIGNLKREIEAANAVGRIRQRSSPDTAAETIETRQTRADVGTNDMPLNAWGSLIAHFRKFLLDLTKFPQAALILTISDDGQHVRLVHQGNLPLQLDLSAVTLKGALWKPSEQVTLSEWSGEPTNLGGIVSAGQGWSLDVPFHPNFKMVAGSAVKVTATLTAFDNDQPMVVALST